jgi:hypothetical protein
MTSVARELGCVGLQFSVALPLGSLLSGQH